MNSVTVCIQKINVEVGRRFFDQFALIYHSSNKMVCLGMLAFTKVTPIPSYKSDHIMEKGLCFVSLGHALLIHDNRLDIGAAVFTIVY